MRTSDVIGVGAFISAVAGLSTGAPVWGGPTPPGPAEVFNLGLRGVYFVENQGQWRDESVHYGLKSRGLDVAFRESSFTMHLSREVERASRPFDPPIAPEASPTRERGLLAFDDPTPLPDGRGSLHAPVEHEHLTLTITFPGSNPVTPRGAQPQTAKFNYFVGGEGRGSASNVPSFGAVIYENLYDGIDLHVTGNDDGVMKYEFHCEPGADYTQIRIHYDGIDSLCVNDDGDLEIVTSFGTLRDGAPIVWQEDAGAQNNAPAPRAGPCRPDEPTIPARFELIDAATYRIALDTPIDLTRELIIDPEVEWMIYLGGAATDYSQGLAMDALGNAYQTGWTNSTDFEGRGNSYFGGNWDSYIAKVDSTGSLLWMAYIGGSAAEFGYGLNTDPEGNVIVIGVTNSSDFAGRANDPFGAYDAFAYKVSAEGTLLWMRYLGGTGDEQADAVAADAAGHLLVTGQTNSMQFSGRDNSYLGGASDAFLVELDPSGSLVRMLYFGGSGRDGGLGVALDHTDRLLLTGLTDSPDFSGRNNTIHAALDIFVLRASRSGVTEWMTYLGGGNDDTGYALVAREDDSLLVSAMTESLDFDGSSNSYHGGERDTVAILLSPDGDLVWAIHLGGAGRERGRGVVLDHDGGAFMTGGTTSLDYEGRVNEHHGGEYDAWIARVSPQGSLDWMMYLGGAGDDWGRGIALPHSTQLFLGGITTSPDFPGRRNSYHGGDVRDSFVCVIRLERRPFLEVEATCPSGGPIRLFWQDASPGQQAALIYAAEEGAFRVPQGQPCAGTELGLGPAGIRLAWRGSAGPEGSRTLDASAGPGACGGYLQLLDLATCATSNVAPIE